MAEQGREPVGFAHAGFGPDETGNRISTNPGVTCVVAVRPKFRGQGIGSQLLRRAEDYLRRRGSHTFFFGAMSPLNPFYLGIYGGSESPGVLLSDSAAEPFLKANGYAVHDATIVMSRNLERAISIPDARFTALRRNYELQILPRAVRPKWFEECQLSPFEMIYFEMKELSTGLNVASAMAWDMDLFGWRWHQPTAGVVAVNVEGERRGQGIGKFLLLQVLQYLREQFFTQAEIQAMRDNTAALRLYETLGFMSIDEGRVYRKESSKRTG